MQGKEGSPYHPLAPTQAPINPPYKTACEVKRGVSQPPSATVPDGSSDQVTSHREKDMNSQSEPDNTENTDQSSS